tara:strand:- start:56 stop:337 length:282 start_codon:yes stop_codon:yes gene_type:complete
MIGKDVELYHKMVGIWSITAMPNLQAVFSGDKVKFNCAGGHIISMEITLLYSLASIEVVNILEDKFTKKYKVDAKVFRKSFDGFKKNPFSSQN